MIKSTLMAVTACIALGSSVYAEDAQGFIGVEVGKGFVKGDTYTEARHKGDAVEYGLRIGAQSNEWRTTFTFDYFNSDSDDQNVEKGMLSLDYFFLNGSDMQMEFKPFIGMNIGYANYESTGIDSSDFIYGAQTGIVVNMTDQIDLDLSYRYSLSASDVFDSDSGVFFGVNYLY